MRDSTYRLTFLLIQILLFLETVDLRIVTYSNSVLDEGSCYKYITSVSYKACMDIFESGKYNVNVVVYSRRFLLCNLCFVTERLKLKKTPGSILVHDPLADTTLKNLAVGKPSSQSSTLGNYVSSLAVDGFWNSDMMSLPYVCAHTYQASGYHWWMVDLENIYPLSKVVILNRSDCCSERLRDLTVTVGETIDNMIMCNKYKGPGGPGERVTITCRNPLVGQFITISKPDTTLVLQLCEVAVYS